MKKEKKKKVRQNSGKTCGKTAAKRRRIGGESAAPF
jgi:hypothetical protein